MNKTHKPSTDLKLAEIKSESAKITGFSVWHRDNNRPGYIEIHLPHTKPGA